jgi:hypothetical protein
LASTARAAAIRPGSVRAVRSVVRSHDFLAMSRWWVDGVRGAGSESMGVPFVIGGPRGEPAVALPPVAAGGGRLSARFSLYPLPTLKHRHAETAVRVPVSAALIHAIPLEGSP